MWRRLVLSAVKLTELFHTINIFNMKKAHNNDQKDHTKKPHVCHFCIAFKGCDFLLLTPSAFFAYPEYRYEGSLLEFRGIVSEVLFSSLQFKFAQTKHILLHLKLAEQWGWATSSRNISYGAPLHRQPGAVARSEASSIGMQAAPSSIPTSSTFFRGDLVMKTFLRPFSLFRWFKKSSCQLLAKECALSTGKLPRRLRRDMTEKLLKATFNPNTHTHTPRRLVQEQCG